MSPANEPRQSKAERTAAAREKAREIREAQLKKDKRNKLLIGWGIVAAVVAIIVVVALVVTSNIKNNAPVADEGPTPANGNVHGGVTLLANTEVAKTDPATVKLSDLPSAPATPPSPVTAPGAEAEAGKPVKVVLYIDFICPVCKNFEAQYNETLTKLRNEGKITRGVPPARLPGQPVHHQLLLPRGQRRSLRGERIPGEVLGLRRRAVREAAGRRQRRALRQRAEEDGHRRRGQEHRHVRG